VKNIIQLLPCSLALLGTVAHANGPTEIIARLSEPLRAPPMNIWQNFSRLPGEIIYNFGSRNHTRPAAAKLPAIQQDGVTKHLINCKTESPAPLGSLAGKVEPVASPSGNKSADDTNDDFFSCRHILLWWSCALIGFFLARMGLIDFLNYVVEEYIWPPNISIRPKSVHSRVHG
jgi:hypothetical protein